MFGTMILCKVQLCSVVHYCCRKINSWIFVDPLLHLKPVLAWRSCYSSRHQIKFCFWQFLFYILDIL